MFFARNDKFPTYVYISEIFTTRVFQPPYIWATRVFSCECWEKGDSNIGEGRLRGEKNAKYYKTLQWMAGNI